MAVRAHTKRRKYMKMHLLLPPPNLGLEEEGINLSLRIRPGQVDNDALSLRTLMKRQKALRNVAHAPPTL
jgi:hypothetical protein